MARGFTCDSLIQEEEKSKYWNMHWIRVEQHGVLVLMASSAKWGGELQSFTEEAPRRMETYLFFHLLREKGKKKLILVLSKLFVIIFQIKLHTSMLITDTALFGLC